VQRVRVESFGEPLLMSSVEKTAEIAGAALTLAESIRAAG
jgi:hypothetical protein